MPRAYREPEYRRRIRQQAEHAQKNADDERGRSAKSADIHEIVLAIEAIGKKYDRETYNEHTRRKWDRFWEVAGVIGLWLAAAVGITAISYGTRDASEQRGVMRGQLNEMEIARRPWITADFHIAGPLEIKDGALTATLGIILRNTGQTPAVRTDIAIDAFPIQEFDISNSIRPVCNQADAMLSHNISIGPSVFPGEAKPTSLYNFSISKPTIAEYRKTIYNTVVIMPIVALCIGYTEFGSHGVHHTSFILRYVNVDSAREVGWTEMPVKASDMAIQLLPVGNMPPD